MISYNLALSASSRVTSRDKCNKFNNPAKFLYSSSSKFSVINLAWVSGNTRAKVARFTKFNGVQLIAGDSRNYVLHADLLHRLHKYGKISAAVISAPRRGLAHTSYTQPRFICSGVGATSKRKKNRNKPS